MGKTMNAKKPNAGGRGKAASSGKQTVAASSSTHTSDQESQANENEQHWIDGLLGEYRTMYCIDVWVKDGFRPQYLFVWECQDEPTWEFAEYNLEATDAADFHYWHPRKPKPAGWKVPDGWKKPFNSVPPAEWEDALQKARDDYPGLFDEEARQQKGREVEPKPKKAGHKKAKNPTARRDGVMKKCTVKKGGQK